MDKSEWFIVGFIALMGGGAVGWWTEGSLPAMWLGITIVSFIAECFNMVLRRMNMLLKVVERGKQDLSLGG